MILNIIGIGAVACVIQVIFLMGIAIGLELYHNRQVEKGTALPKYPKNYEVENTPLADHKELKSKSPASLGFRLTWDFTVIFNLLVMVILLASAAVWLPVGNSIYQSLRTRNFPTAEGVILPLITEDDPDITYQYRVNDRDYVETGAYFGGGLSQNQSLDDTYAKYPPESRVQVYYNPDDPTDSALERPDSQHWRDNVALGTLIFAIAAGIFGRRVWRSGRKFA